MNFDLFGQTLLIATTVVGTGLTSFLVTQMKKKRNVPDLLGFSILAAVSLQLGLAYYLGSSSQDELPKQLWLMALPWVFSVSLIFGIVHVRKQTKMTKKKRRRTRIIYAPVFINILSCLLFGLLLVNSYYRYYPTFYSLIGRNQGTAAALNSSGQVMLQYNAKGQPTTNSSTLESSLYSSSTTPTSGRLYDIAIPGKISKFHPRDAWVYVPAIASQDPNALNLPVLVLLAGFPGAPTDWLHGVNLVSTMDAFAKQHHGITPIVFAVDDTGTQFNDTECVNSPRGNVETYLTQDVPNYIKAHFPVSDSPNNWAVGGLSMGGTCAAMLSLVHPNVYQTFLDMGGELGPSLDSDAATIQLLFHGSIADWQAHQPLYLLAHHQYSNMGGFFASGNTDDPTTVADTRQLYVAAKQDGVSAVYETVQGPHTFNVFSQIFKDALPWLSNRVGATSCNGSTTCT